jgi:HEAT repeat protein
LDDEDVAGHAVDALGRLRAPEALSHLDRFLQHPKAWIRKEAKKAINRIEKEQAKRH